MPMMVTCCAVVRRDARAHGALNPGALVSFMLYQTQLTSCFGAIADVFTVVTTALGRRRRCWSSSRSRRSRAWPSDDEREADLGAVLRPATREVGVRRPA